MRQFAFFSFVFVMFSCGEASQKSQGNDLSDEQAVSEDAIDSTQEEVVEEQFNEPKPENIQRLYDFFCCAESFENIPDSIVKELHDSKDNAPVDGFYADQFGFFDEGYVFVYHTPLGASDLYAFTDYKMAYFDTLGNYKNTVSVSANDHDVHIEMLAYKMVYISNDYLEFVEDENGFAFEATGDTIHQYNVYVSTVNKLVELKDIEQDQLPYLRNRIYAQKGYIFKSDKYADHFSQFDWYHPSYNDVEGALGPTEKETVDFIKSLEKKD